MDEARRTVQFLGKQFMLESDLDERDVTSGTVYSKRPNLMNASLKKSQIFDLARGGTLQRKASMLASKESSLKQMGLGVQPRFQGRDSLANLAFSQTGGFLKRQESKGTM